MFLLCEKVGSPKSVILRSLCVWCERSGQRLVVEIVIPQALRKNAKQEALWGACLKIVALERIHGPLWSLGAQDHVFLCGSFVVTQRQWGLTEI